MDQLNKGYNNLIKYFDRFKFSKRDLKEKMKSKNLEIYKRSNDELNSLVLRIIFVLFPLVFLNLLLTPEFLFGLVSLLSVILMSSLLGIALFVKFTLVKMKKMINKTGEFPKIFGLGVAFKESQMEMKKIIEDSKLNTSFVLPKKELEYHYEILNQYLTEKEIIKVINEDKSKEIGRYSIIKSLYEKAKNKNNKYSEEEKNIKIQLDLLSKKTKNEEFKIRSDHESK